MICHVNKSEWSSLTSTLMSLIFKITPPPPTQKTWMCCGRLICCYINFLLILLELLEWSAPNRYAHCVDTAMFGVFAEDFVKKCRNIFKINANAVLNSCMYYGCFVVCVVLPLSTRDRSSLNPGWWQEHLQRIATSGIFKVAWRNHPACKSGLAQGFFLLFLFLSTVLTWRFSI